jgi:hypothetical protein
METQTEGFTPHLQPVEPVVLKQKKFPQRSFTASQIRHGAQAAKSLSDLGRILQYEGHLGQGLRKKLRAILGDAEYQRLANNSLSRK